MDKYLVGMQQADIRCRITNGNGISITHMVTDQSQCLNRILSAIGTANQITVNNNGIGNVTLLPQNIYTTATPNFSSETLPVL